MKIAGVSSWVGMALLLGSTMMSAPPAWAAKLGVRAVQNPQYTRLVFDWPGKLSINPAQGQVTLGLDSKADIDEKALKAALGEKLRDFQQSADGKSIILTFDKTYRTRHFVSGNAYGLDVMETPQAVATPLPVVTPEAEKTPPAEQVGDDKNVLRVPTVPKAADKKQAASVIAAPAIDKVQAKEEAPAKPEAPVISTLPAGEEKVVNQQDDPKATTDESNKTAVADNAKPEQAAAPEEQKTQAKADDVTLPAMKDKAPDAAKASEPEEKTVDNPATETPAITEEASVDAPFIITSQVLATGTEIRFPWKKRVAAAAFTRAKDIWLVFSDEQDLNKPLVESIMPAAVEKVDFIEADGHTIIRLATNGSIYPKIIQPKNSNEWWLILSNYPQIPTMPVALELKAKNTLKPSIFLPILEAAETVQITDVTFGDTIHVMPLFGDGIGIYPPRKFADVEVLQSAQGLAIIPQADLVTISALRNGLRIGSPQGLNLSVDLPTLALDDLDNYASQSRIWFPYERWRTEPGQLIEKRRELEEKLIGAGELRANGLRLQLAQMYFADGLAREALGWINLIKDSDPSYYAEHKLEALEAGIHFMLDDYTQAGTLFRAKSLADQAEQALWLQALNLANEDRPRFDFLDFYPTYISKYPPVMREKLSIIAADNYINRKNYKRALDTLDTLSAEGISPPLVPYVDFLIGKIAAEGNQLENAKKIWEPLISENDDRFVRARAAFSLTSLRYRLGEISLQQAIEELDRLRVVWRGDALELSLLNYLGELYAENNDYLNALRVWQELVQQFPESPIAPAVTAEMSRIFRALFADGKADALKPLEALSIFYEFRQFTPIGEDGDIMTQNLATRLVDVDLLDSAAELLEHQIEFRQEKLARSKLGTQLAMIHLMNGEPKKALGVLEVTGYGDNPEALNVRRKRLAAMAYADANEPERGLSMLENDTSRAADDLRLRLYWKMNSWPNVIAVAEAILAARPDRTAMLSGLESETALQLAIAYMYERNRTQLQYLRNYFSPLFPDGPAREIFEYVTNASGPIDPQAFSQFSKQIDSIENFMNRYDDQVQELPLSPALN